jgi:hypothetical protein
MESIADESIALDVSEVSFLHRENSGTKRSWSKSCKTFLNWKKKKEACDTFKFFRSTTFNNLI